MRKKEKYCLPISKGKKQSRFRVDLNQSLINVSSASEKVRQSNNLENNPFKPTGLNDGSEKKNDLNFEIYTQLNDRFHSHQEESTFEEISSGERKFLKEVQAKIKKFDSKLEGLSFYFLVKNLSKFLWSSLKIILKITYFPGAGFVFVIRFIYFSFIKFRELFGSYKSDKFDNLSNDKLKFTLFKNDIDDYNIGKIFSLPDLPKHYEKIAPDKRDFIYKEKLQTKAEPKAKQKNKFSIAPELHAFKESLKTALAFTVIASLIIMPFKVADLYNNFSLQTLKSGVLGQSKLGVNNFMGAAEAASSMDLKSAESNFYKASMNFQQAQTELGVFKSSLIRLARFLPQEKLKIASYGPLILEAGELASKMGEDLSSGLNSLLETENNLDKINIFKLKLASAQERLGYINKLMEEIDISDIPEDYQSDFEKLVLSPQRLENALSETIELLDLLELMLGRESDQRYLLVFQNNSEMRGSGGFVGSYALLDIRQGKIKNLEIPGGGSYDTEAGLTKFIIAPKPLHIVNPLWHFWDANWWPDWQKSAEKLAWFYEKSDGPTVDGVIGVTPSIAEDLLRVIGPVDMSEYGLSINADNFYTIVQTLSERKPDETKIPKKIIGDLIEKILEELPSRLNKDVLFELVKVMEDSLNEKQLLFFFQDEYLQQQVEKFNWAGKISHAPGDYLMIADSNIAGGKSDRVMKKTVKLSTTVTSEGEIINTLEIRRTHTGTSSDELTGLRNNDWLRIYVPEGSELLEAKGFSKLDENVYEKPDPEWEKDPDLMNEINARMDSQSGVLTYVESGKTVFAHWVQVDPGKTRLITIKYRLPFKINFSSENNNNNEIQNNFMGKIHDYVFGDNPNLGTYSFLFEKQPGSMPMQFSSDLKLYNNSHIVWSNNEKNINLKDNTWQINDEFNKDDFFVVLLEKQKGAGI